MRIYGPQKENCHQTIWNKKSNIELRQIHNKSLILKQYFDIEELHRPVTRKDPIA